MIRIIRNVLAVLLGVGLGGAVNMGLVMLGPVLISPPAGVDVTDPESIAASAHLFQARHFLFPFLAHALGTTVGAAVAWLTAAAYRDYLAWVIGLFFLAGGVTASLMIPAPTWFIIVDLGLAYLPSAWLGIRVAKLLAPLPAA